ncbi:lytic transglycosylase domain-containing protein [Hydrogenophaga sp. RWCD_12]|uniref:lytic transglycosylase domain-containing protein n=1 Tax=Hydrogenophaga sp. RWCD_12 TaxID=3391190 RepID=UPI0039854EEE
MLDCPDLAVPKEVMQHVVHVESSRNPFAIGVVGGYLARQPRNLEEALASVRQLKEEGYNFSVGISQVNRYNLAKYGLHTYAEAFEICPNLKAGSRILRECYDRAQDWGKAFSCYYSGNFVTGFEQGYVQKIFASIRKSQAEQSAPEAIRVIPYGNGQRRPGRDDGLPLGGGAGEAVATRPAAAYPEPASVRKTLVATSVANMDTAEARPAIPAPGLGAVMPPSVVATKPKGLDLSQIPTQVVGVNGDPYQTKVLRAPGGTSTEANLTLPMVPQTALLPPRRNIEALPSRLGLRTGNVAMKGGVIVQSSEASAASGPAKPVPVSSGEGPSGNKSVSTGDQSFVF